MIMKIGKPSIIKSIIFLLLSVNLYSQESAKVEIREGIYALELCTIENVSLCGNGFRESKTPQLVPLYQ